MDINESFGFIFQVTTRTVLCLSHLILAGSCCEFSHVKCWNVSPQQHSISIIQEVEQWRTRKIRMRKKKLKAKQVIFVESIQISMRNLVSNKQVWGFSVVSQLVCYKSILFRNFGIISTCMDDVWWVNNGRIGVVKWMSMVPSSEE